jgi:hypothetical protein
MYPFRRHNQLGAALLVPLWLGKWSFSIYGKLNVAGQHFAKDVFIAVAAS